MITETSILATAVILISLGLAEIFAFEIPRYLINRKEREYLND